MSDKEIQALSEERSTTLRLFVEGKPVSELTVVDLEMHVGCAVVKMGGIAGVGTEREHRNKGYSRRVLEYATEWMTSQGYDCATLFGIPNYYPKFGYAVCLAECWFELATRNVESAERHLEARPFTQEDLPALRDIYAHNNQELTGSIVRNEKTPWFSHGSYYSTGAEPFVFTEAAGEVVAYVVRDKVDAADPDLDRIRVCEVGARSPACFGDIARWAAEEAIRLRVGTVSFLLPHEHPFGIYLTQFGAKQIASYTQNGGGMGRLLRQSAFLDRTLPEWTRRAAASPALTPGLSLRLETELGSDTLRWTGRAVEREADAPAEGTVNLPQFRLMQLAMGYLSPEIVLTAPEVQSEGDLTLLHALFPRRQGYMWLCDHF